MADIASIQCRVTYEAIARCAVASLAFGAALFCGAIPALAEICDKALGDAWLPSHGPMIVQGMSLPASFVLAIGVVTMGLVVGRKAAIPLLATGSLIAGLSAREFADGVSSTDNVIKGMVAEGCRALWADAVGVGLGLALVVVAVRLRRRGQ